MISLEVYVNYQSMRELHSQPTKIKKEFMCSMRSQSVWHACVCDDGWVTQCRFALVFVFSPFALSLVFGWAPTWSLDVAAANHRIFYYYYYHHYHHFTSSKLFRSYTFGWSMATPTIFFFCCCSPFLVPRFGPKSTTSAHSTRIYS